MIVLNKKYLARIGIITICLFIFGTACFVIYKSDIFQSKKKSVIYVDKYENIEKGMTLKQVSELIGYGSPFVYESNYLYSLTREWSIKNNKILHIVFKMDLSSGDELWEEYAKKVEGIKYKYETRGYNFIGDNWVNEIYIVSEISVISNSLRKVADIQNAIQNIDFPETKALIFGNNVSFSDLPVNSSAQYQILKMFASNRFLVSCFPDTATSLDWLCNVYLNPVLNFQIIDENHIGCVYKVEDDEQHECCMLIVCSKDVEHPDSETYLEWVTTGEVYYNNPDQLLSFSDFDSVSVGCHVDDLCIIDDSFCFDVQSGGPSPKEITKYLNQSEKESIAFEYYSLYKILRDGIYFVEYGAADKIITDIIFYPFSDWEGVPYVSVNDADFLENLFAE